MTAGTPQTGRLIPPATAAPPRRGGPQDAEGTLRGRPQRFGITKGPILRKAPEGFPCGVRVEPVRDHPPTQGGHTGCLTASCGPPLRKVVAALPLNKKALSFNRKGLPGCSTASREFVHGLQDRPRMRHERSSIAEEPPRIVAAPAARRLRDPTGATRPEDLEWSLPGPSSISRRGGGAPAPGRHPAGAPQPARWRHRPGPPACRCGSGGRQ